MEQFSREYTEWLTGNDTCHRPDIICYGFCDECPYVRHCLCSLRKTSKCTKERIRARRKRK